MTQASTRKCIYSPKGHSNSIGMLTFSLKNRKNNTAKIKVESSILRMRSSKKLKIS